MGRLDFGEVGEGFGVDEAGCCLNAQGRLVTYERFHYLILVGSVAFEVD